MKRYKEFIKEEREKSNKIEIHPALHYTKELGHILGNSSMQKDDHDLIALIIKRRPYLYSRSVGEIIEPKPYLDNIPPFIIRSIQYPWMTRRFKESLNKVFAEIGSLWENRTYEPRTIKDFPNSNDVFNSLLEVIHPKTGYFWHSCEMWYIVVACWIIGTYFHKIFSHYSNLFLKGDKDTGKTSLMNVIIRTAWNPTLKSTGITAPNIYRRVNDQCITYCVDITKLNMKYNPIHKALIDIFESGTERDTSVPRLEKVGGKYKPVDYMLYSPKVLATHTDVDFRDKCIKINTEKAPNSLLGILGERGNNIKDDSRFDSIVYYLIKSIVYHSGAVITAYKRMRHTKKLKGRPFDYFRSILAICKVFSRENFNELLAFVEDYAQELDKLDKTVRSNRIKDLLRSILYTDYCIPHKEQRSIMILQSELLNKVQRSFPVKITYHYVESALTNLGVIKRKTTKGGNVAFQIDLDTARQQYEDTRIDTRAVTEEIEIGLKKELKKEMDKDTEKKEIIVEKETMNKAQELENDVKNIVANNPDATREDILTNGSLLQKWGKTDLELVTDGLIRFGHIKVMVKKKEEQQQQEDDQGLIDDIFRFVGKLGALEERIIRNIALRQKYGKTRLTQMVDRLITEGKLYYDDNECLQIYDNEINRSLDRFQ